MHYDRFYVTGVIGSCAADEPANLLHRVIDHTDQGFFEQSPFLPHISPDNQSVLGYMPCRDEFECVRSILFNTFPLTGVHEQRGESDYSNTFRKYFGWTV